MFYVASCQKVFSKLAFLLKRPVTFRPLINPFCSLENVGSATFSTRWTPTPTGRTFFAFLLFGLCSSGIWGLRAQAETAATDTEWQQAAALLDEIEADTERTFTYQGETFLIREGLEYANTFLRGTDDYDPFCTALMEAQLVQSAEQGELFLQAAKLLNAYAVKQGYENYLEYSAWQYGMPSDISQLTQRIQESLPMTVRFLSMHCGWLLTPIEAEGIIDIPAFWEQAAGMYGKLSPEYQQLVEELAASDILEIQKVDTLSVRSEVAFSGTSVMYVLVSYRDELEFPMMAMHELGHYLHWKSAQEPDVSKYYSIFETHSTAGVLLCAQDMEAYFRQLLGDQDGAFATLRYLVGAIMNLPSVLTGYAFLQDVLLNPEAYEPEELAALYLQKSLEFGFDGGFSEAYQMMHGARWTDEVIWTDKPVYLAAYGWGYLNSLWMWYQQAQGIDMTEAYNRLLQTALPDLPLETFHRQMGLPDLTNDEAFEGLDDFVYGTLSSLYREVYQEDPL